MAHPAQLAFFEVVKQDQPQFFQNCRVLDVGSLNINGDLRSLFTNCEYVGLDLGSGKNVDVVCKAHEYQAPDASFDVVVSAECFEHDMYIKLTLQNIIRMLKPGGLFAFSCANRGRPEHGTITNEPSASPFTIKIPGWCEYYQGLDREDFEQMLNFNTLFPTHTFRVREFDLYFCGIRGNESPVLRL